MSKIQGTFSGNLRISDDTGAVAIVPVVLSLDTTAPVPVEPVPVPVEPVPVPVEPVPVEPAPVEPVPAISYAKYGEHIVDSSGAKWELVEADPVERPGTYAVLRNREHFASGYGLMLAYSNKQIYVMANSGIWYCAIVMEQRGEWIAVSFPPPFGEPPIVVPPTTPTVPTAPTTPTTTDRKELPLTLTPSNLEFRGLISTAVGADPAQAEVGYGKHTQWQDIRGTPYVVSFGGDFTRLRLPINGYQSYLHNNTILLYDLSQGAKLTQLKSVFGSLDDGTAPYYHDGCPLGYSQKHRMLYSFVGYQSQYRPENDPFGIMQKDMGKVHAFQFSNDFTGGKWIAGPVLDNMWRVGESWAGDFHEETQTMILHYTGPSDYGVCKKVSVVSWAVTNTAMQPIDSASFVRVDNLGYGVHDSSWRQPIIGNMQYSFDAYRGLILGYDVTDPLPKQKIIARVRKLVQYPGGDAVGAIEAGVTASVVNRKIFISYPSPSQVEGGVSGIAEIDVDTGKSSWIDYPVVAGVGEAASYTECVFNDATNTLLVTGNLDIGRSKQFLVFTLRPAAISPTAPTVPTTPIIPTAPTSTVAPSWLANEPVKKWIAIPNSQLTAHLGDEWFASLGLPRPSQRAAPYKGLVDWGTNKYGIRESVYNDFPWSNAGGINSFSGMMFDDLASVMYTGGGDAHWADNSMHKFSYGQDAPVWTQAVIAGTHKDNYKTPTRSPITYPDTTANPADDTRPSRHYDGRRRGGHNYWSGHFFRSRQWLAYFGQQQFWPIDMGSAAEVHVADLRTKQWLKDNPVPDVPRWSNDANAWQAKHPITEDLYYWGEFDGNMYRWDCAKNMWTVHLDAASESGYRLTGAINWDDGYVLCDGLGGDGYTVHHTWIMPLDNPTKIMCRVIGPHYDKLNLFRNGGITWCPDLECFLFYRDDDGHVYSATRTGPSQITVDRVPMLGTGPAPRRSELGKAGGVLSCWQYDRSLKGIFFRVSDNDLCYFIRTGF